MAEVKMHERHNLLTPIGIKLIARGMIDAGGDQYDCMVLLESVIAGSLVALVPNEIDDTDLVNGLMEGVKERVVEIRKALKEKKN